MSPERRRIEAALEIARRPTTIEGERVAALDRALAMIEKHKLDLDDFDIPGRTRSKPKPPPASAFRDSLFDRPRAPDSYTAADVSDAVRAFRAGMEAARQAEAAKAERERESYMAEAFDFLSKNGRGPRSTSARAADFLNARGVPCYRSGDAWALIIDGELCEVSEREVVQMAERRGFKP